MSENAVRKAVILARGMGKRMRRSAGELALDPAVRRFVERGWKPFIPIRGKPFIWYQLRALSEAGIREVCLVVGPEHLELREQLVRLGEEAGVEVGLAVQEKPLGTANAVYASKGFVGSGSFILLNGDNYYPEEALKALVSAGDPGRCYVAGFSLEKLVERSNFTPERVKAFSVMLVDEEFNLVRIVEKPEDPERYRTRRGILVNMNLWRFNPLIFAACELVEPHPVRGELELTAAVQLMVDRGMCAVKVVPVDSYVLDLTYASDIEAVERILGSGGKA